MATPPRPVTPVSDIIVTERDFGARIAVPTITIDGKQDPFTPPGNGSAYRGLFTGKYRHLTFDVGHNVPQEAPLEFAEAVVAVDQLALNG
jgi:pimeloyl-ACP methyl ester carboxylesterase